MRDTLNPKLKLMTFLKINNLSVNYEMRRETVYAAKKVNINVEKGEILGLGWRIWIRKKHSW